MNKNDNPVVRKSNKLLQSRFKNWDLNELRFLLLMSSNLGRFSNQRVDVWTCRVSELEKILDLKKISAKYLIQSCEKIKDLTIDFPDHGGIYSPKKAFESASYNDGELRIELTDFLKSQILKTDALTTPYNLENVIDFSSQYSIKMYEKFVSISKSKGNSFTLDIPIKEIREDLSIEDGLYERFSNLDARVLKPLVNEINEKSNMAVSYEKIKYGKNIDSILFYVTLQTKKHIEAEKLKSGDTADKNETQAAVAP